ncbi:MAG: hypothetical protein KAS25_00600 [Dehalococcoidales bacterium]|nr:hypothetical protein [Dehalococcoidales bacterium]
MKFTQGLAILVMVLGLVSIVIGGVFIGQGFAKNNLIVDRMEIEKVTLAIDPENPDEYTLIADIDAAQVAADTIAEHRRNIAPTYQELLAGERYDPTNPAHLSYAQAMNLENYLYLAVAAFGLVQVALASGAFMVVTGLALGGTGWALLRVHHVHS